MQPVSRAGDPNGSELPRWPEKQENAHIFLDSVVEARPDDWDEALGKICACACDVLESGTMLLQN